MPLADYGEDRVLDVLFGASPKPDPVYIALTYSEPTDTSTGSTLDEPTAVSYARVAIPNNATSWAPAMGGVKRNAASVAFPTATENWGFAPLVFFALCTSATGGFLIGWGVLSAGRRIYTGMTPRFDAGDLSITAAD